MCRGRGLHRSQRAEERKGAVGACQGLGWPSALLPLHHPALPGSHAHSTYLPLSSRFCPSEPYLAWHSWPNSLVNEHTNVRRNRLQAQPIDQVQAWSL